jgi:hypothetical protein
MPGAKRAAAKDRCRPDSRADTTGRPRQGRKSAKCTDLWVRRMSRSFTIAVFAANTFDDFHRAGLQFG